MTDDHSRDAIDTSEECMLHEDKSWFEREPFLTQRGGDICPDEDAQRSKNSQRKRILPAISPHKKKSKIDSKKTQSDDTFRCYESHDTTEKEPVFPLTFHGEYEWCYHEEISSDIVRITESARAPDFPPTPCHGIGSSREDIDPKERLYYSDTGDTYRWSDDSRGEEALFSFSEKSEEIPEPDESDKKEEPMLLLAYSEEELTQCLCMRKIEPWNKYERYAHKDEYPFLWES
jgi:hypothetical protein